MEYHSAEKSAPPMNYGQPPPPPPPKDYGHPPPMNYGQPPPPPKDYGHPPPMNYGPPPPVPANGIPVLAPTAPLLEGPWSSGLCDCTSDCSNCCLTCWCPCITFGQVADIVDKGTTSCGTSGALYALISYATGCACIYSCFYRQKMRKQYMLAEDPCNDCLIHFCCESCALCQEYRELKHRGFDMSLGWHGNVERNQGVAMAAPYSQGGMSR